MKDGVKVLWNKNFQCISHDFEDNLLGTELIVVEFGFADIEYLVKLMNDKKTKEANGQ